MKTKTALLGAIIALGLIAQSSVPVQAAGGCVSAGEKKFCYTKLPFDPPPDIKLQKAYLPPQEKPKYIAGLAAGPGGICTKQRAAALVSNSNSVYCWKSGANEGSAQLTITEPFVAIFPDLESLERAAAPGKNCVAKGMSAQFTGARVDCVPTPQVLLRAVNDSDAGRRSNCEGQDCVPDKFRRK